MFGWFKKKLQPAHPDARVERFSHHFEAAEGSQIHRGCIAAAMVALEEEPIRKQRSKLSGEAQVIFMMTYECFVMWAMKRGLDSLLKPIEVELIITGMQRHFAKHGFYRPKAFEKIWDQMQVVMPLAMNPTPEGVIFPAAEMLMAPTLAGYQLDPMISVDAEFGIFIGLVVGDLGRVARAQAMPSPKH